jgi:hypothetical protein
MEYIKTMEISQEYLVMKTIDFNNYAFTDYKEGYSAEFNDLAQLKHEELKEF